MSLVVPRRSKSRCCPRSAVGRVLRRCSTRSFDDRAPISRPWRPGSWGRRSSSTGSPHGWYGFYVWRLPAEHQVNHGSYDRVLHRPISSLRSGSPSSSARSASRRSGRDERRGLRSMSSSGRPHCSRLRTPLACTRVATTTCCCRSTRRIAVLLRASACTTRCGRRSGRGSWRSSRSHACCSSAASCTTRSPKLPTPGGRRARRSDARGPAPAAAADLPARPSVVPRRDRPAHEHAVAAIGDVLRGGGAEGRKLAQELWRTVAEQRYGSIVVESAVGYSYLPDNLCRYYEPARPLLAERRGVVPDHRDDHRSGRGVAASCRAGRPETARPSAAGRRNRRSDSIG